mgnify:FL=1
MTREEVAKLLPILQAFAEGKDIEFRRNSNGMKSLWYAVRDEINLENSSDYEFHINTPPTYRPFVNKEECWNEMLKHQPCGYLLDKKCEDIILVTGIDKEKDDISICGNRGWDYEGVMENYTFADGAPFGIKEEE